jgi:hypothetical protein
MSVVIFAGPSMPPSAAARFAGFDWRPPVRQGELYLAARSGPRAIGVIDGYFERTPTVWHKEILWAMSQGIHVYGAASIGALRAAELTDLGMNGVGVIFEQYRSGQLSDDDDVAVLHGPEEIDYVQVTVAMVNVRATIEAALQAAVVTPDAAAVLLGIAKGMFYKERTYDAILEAATASGLQPGALRRFTDWLPLGQVDQKRRDAEAMLGAMAVHLGGDVKPLEVAYAFAHTFAWEEARRWTEQAVDDRAAGVSSVAEDHTHGRHGRLESRPSLPRHSSLAAGIGAAR